MKVKVHKRGRRKHSVRSCFTRLKRALPFQGWQRPTIQRVQDTLTRADSFITEWGSYLINLTQGKPQQETTPSDQYQETDPGLQHNVFRGLVTYLPPDPETEALITREETLELVGDTLIQMNGEPLSAEACLDIAWRIHDYCHWHSLTNTQIIEYFEDHLLNSDELPSPLFITNLALVIETLIRLETENGQEAYYQTQEMMIQLLITIFQNGVAPLPSPDEIAEWLCRTPNDFVRVPDAPTAGIMLGAYVDDFMRENVATRTKRVEEISKKVSHHFLSSRACLSYFILTGIYPKRKQGELLATLAGRDTAIYDHMDLLSDRELLRIAELGHLENTEARHVQLRAFDILTERHYHRDQIITRIAKAYENSFPERV
jgi:hypothetical protein